MKGGQANEPLGGAGGGEGEGGGADVSAELLMQARAEEAESKCAEQEARISELEAKLVAAREATDASERRREIERALGESDTVDVETARLLTEAAVAQMDEPDVALAVDELRRRKPFLFHGEPAAAQMRGIAMRPAQEMMIGDGALDGLADEARQTGDRRVLLRYLRQRRCGY